MRTARAYRLRAQDRSGNRDRQGGELYVVDDLIHGAVRGSGLRAKAIDQRKQHDLRQRNDDHLNTCRQADSHQQAQQARIDAQRAQQLHVGRQCVIAATHVHGKECQRAKERDDGRGRRAGHPQLRQAPPAANERGGQHARHRRRQQQRVKRSHGVTHATHQLREQDEHQQARHRQHHHACIADGNGQHVRRCTQHAQQHLGEGAADHSHESAKQQSQAQRRAGDGLDLVRLARAPGLANQHRRARADPDDQGDEEEHDREHPRHCRERTRPQHLPDEHVVKRPR
jgi:hypothetical protein